MAVARTIEDIDTHAYWSDVTKALVSVCGLPSEEAETEVGEARLALSCLSDWGRLLAYHESVPRAVEDIWKQWHDGGVQPEEAARVRQELIEWYAERNRRRGLP